MSLNSMLNEARKHLGYKEGRNNDTIFGRWYTKQVGRQYNWQPWCAMFISYCAAKSGNSNVIPRHAFTPSGAQWFKNRGQWHKTKPQVGDIVYFNLSRRHKRISHVGIVEKVHRFGYFTTIEGNTDIRGGRTGGQVMRKKRRNVGRLGGFGRPNYSGSTTSNIELGGRMLRKGDRGNDVKELQRLLNKHLRGSDWDLQVDGDFGELTERSVRRFQAKNNLEVDGIAGPATLKKLRGPVKTTTPPAPKPEPKPEVVKVGVTQEQLDKLKKEIKEEVMQELTRRINNG